MDWKKLLTDLIESGMTQTAIADAIGLTQGAISQVLNDTSGKRKGFQYEPGSKLVELHRQRVIDAPKTESAEEPTT